MSETKSPGRHAVVIGGSMGGLLSARVLSDYFDNVTVVERDEVGDSVEPRKGVPQGNHVHTIYGGGANVVERLLPGLFEKMVSEGATECDFSKGLVWYHQGVWKMRTDTGLTSFWQSRAFLESHIRRRVREFSNVNIIENCDAESLLSTDDNSQVTGVRVTHRNDDRTEELPADLVVDTSGRGSKTPEWLEQLGYQKPKELAVGIDLAYASRIYERPDDSSRDWTVMGLFPTPPASQTSRLHLSDRRTTLDCQRRGISGRSSAGRRRGIPGIREKPGTAGLLRSDQRRQTTDTVGDVSLSGRGSAGATSCCRGFRKD